MDLDFASKPKIPIHFLDLDFASGLSKPRFRLLQFHSCSTNPKIKAMLLLLITQLRALTKGSIH